MGYLIVFLGAGIGGALRHGTNLACARLCGTAFPWGTLTVNVVGSLVMGLLAVYERGQLGLSLIYALASGGLSIAGLFLGLFVVRAWS